MFQKRVITKLHILKENNSLGLHVAGGKGSKRGDIGIFVAGITENGPAFRYSQTINLLRNISKPELKNLSSSKLNNKTSLFIKQPQ